MAASELESLVEECISKCGVHLIELVIRGEGMRKSIEIFVDGEQGVTTQMCSEVSREVDRMIGSVGIVKGSYRLTVSSPGISRPLKYAWQYGKHVGRELVLKVGSQDEMRDLVGTLESANQAGILIASGKNVTPELIAFDRIVEARVKAPW